MKNLSIVAIVLCAGCAVVSKIEPTGGNEYFLTASAAPARGGVAGASRMVYERAGKFCIDRQMKMEVISEETGHDFPAAGRDVLRFRCVAP